MAAIKHHKNKLKQLASELNGSQKNVQKSSVGVIDAKIIVLNVCDVA